MNRITLASIIYAVLGGLLFLWSFKSVHESGMIQATNFTLNWNVILVVALLIMAIIRMSPIPDVPPPDEKFDRFYVQLVRVIFIFSGAVFASLAIRWIDATHFSAGIFWSVLSIVALYYAPQLIFTSQLRTTTIRTA